MDVQIRTLETQATMMVHKVIPYDKLGEAFMEAMPKVGAYAGGVAVGPPFGRYPSFSPEQVDVEIGIPVAAAMEPSDDIEPGEIPGGRYAVAVHVGAYDTLPQTYDALYAWVRENGHTDNGAPFESYIDDPQTKPMDEVRTEVCIPIA